jgi:uncharacterized membrane protein YfcA
VWLPVTVALDPPLDLTWLQLVVVLTVTTFAVLVQGTIGFGLGLLAAPVLVAIDPVFVPGPILAIASLLTLLVSRRELADIAFADVGPVFIGRLPGTIAGAATMVVLPLKGLVITVGVLVLLSVALSVAGLRVERTRKTLVTAGVLSGFMSTVSSVGGPPLAIAYQRATGGHLRATLSAHFVLGSTMSLAALLVAGRFGRAELTGALLLLPAMVTGYLLSHRTVGIFDESWTRPAVLGLSALAGAAIILRELF